jgi:hypothetical protein
MENEMKSEMYMHSISMIFISIIAGLLSTMNVWVVSIEDIRIHINDFYMVFLMTGFMLLFQSLFFYNKIENINFLIIIAVLIITFAFIAIRSQFLVLDKQYLNGMIPHHSMAILMSEKIKDKTKNEKIKKMAEGIIKNQRDEIDKINEILKSYI